jgi:peptidoglycan/xylan/chitin deacetylase (PgdA/CDA1 family)
MGQSVEQAVVITFDDGYRDFYTHAFGVLAELKMTATVFAISGLTGKSREGRDYLSARELREIHGRGMRIGSHTISHPHLHGMASAAVEVELRQSRFDLEDTIGGPVQSFSYPYAFPEQDRQFTSGLRKMLVNSGYENGVSTILGRAGKGDDPIFLPRVPISSYDDHRLFRAKLEGKYDWVRLGQIVYKHLRGRSPSSSKSAIAIAGGLE